MIFFQIKEKIKLSPAKRDKVIIFNLWFALSVNLVLWIILLFSFWRTSDYIILGYNIYFGISAFGPWYQILLLPLIGLIIIAVNFLLAFFVYLPQKILSYFLVIAATVVNVIVLAAGMLLVFSNL
ncbi:hypothetical protein HZA71_02565 [Candidatus Falkowbacteria bacterium]|nr:hypothetical protein [Candidatus Falkowbacteria bacterium]